MIHHRGRTRLRALCSAEGDHLQFLVEMLRQITILTNFHHDHAQVAPELVYIRVVDSLAEQVIEVERVQLVVFVLGVAGEVPTDLTLPIFQLVMMHPCERFSGGRAIADVDALREVGDREV